ncbi:MAG: hypothetical protein QXI54_01440 [Archaeoglobaceae archaeon]
MILEIPNLHFCFFVEVRRKRRRCKEYIISSGKTGQHRRKREKEEIQVENLGK